jgi:hypothetical protein
LGRRHNPPTLAGEIGREVSNAASAFFCRIDPQRAPNSDCGLEASIGAELAQREGVAPTPASERHVTVRVTGTRHSPSPSAVGRGALMLSCYEIDVGIDNTDLMCELDVRLAVSFSRISE